MQWQHADGKGDHVGREIFVASDAGEDCGQGWGLVDDERKEEGCEKRLHAGLGRSMNNGGLKVENAGTTVGRGEINDDKGGAARVYTVTLGEICRFF